MKNLACLALVVVASLVSGACKKESVSAAPPPSTKTAESPAPQVAPPPSPTAPAKEESAPAAEEIHPDTAADPSKACPNVDISQALDSSPADSHAAIQLLAAAMKNNDASGLESLLADPVLRHGANEEHDLVLNRIASLGPLDVFGFEANDVHDAATDKVQCLVTVQAQKGKGGTIELFAGSGYGETPIVRLAKQKGAWKLVAIEKIDLGAP